MSTMTLLRMCWWLFLVDMVVVGQLRGRDHQLHCPVGQLGYFADLTNCSRYVQCADGRLVDHHACPSNRHWHVTGLGHGFCDLPQSSGCQLRGVTDPLDLGEQVTRDPSTG